ncbi:phage tail family protein [Bacillus haynesii]|nr:phage tail family protein [Bacillus haynesii]MEC0739168.1 phage tail family protein [Bacillus haynesii]
MDLTIERLNGDKYVLSEYGIVTRDFVIDSPEALNETETIEGMDGAIDVGTTYGPRTMTGSFYFKAVDHYDYPLLRNEVYRIFQSKEAFYIIDSREPWRRWLAKVDGKFSPDQQRIYGFIEVPFISASPYAESVGTSLSNFTTDVNLWGFGNGLFAEDYRYVHTDKSFRIYNAGDATVDPRNKPLKITIKSKKNISKVSIGLYNATTKDEWTYTGSMNTTLPIVINGTRTVRSATSLTDKTNYDLITLAPGWNSIQVTGEEVAEVSFDFRFYYL